MLHNEGCNPISPDPGGTAPGPPPLHVTPSCNKREIVLNLRGNGMPLDLDVLSK